MMTAIDPSQSVPYAYPQLSAEKLKQRTARASTPEEATAKSVLAQPRKDVLALGDKLYIETSPQELVEAKRRALQQQHPRPAWVNNLLSSAIAGGVFGVIHGMFSIASDLIYEVPLTSKRLKQQALSFSLYFGISTLGLFAVRSITEALDKRNDN